MESHTKFWGRAGHIEVDVILQNVGGEGKTDFTFTVCATMTVQGNTRYMFRLGRMEITLRQQNCKVSVVG